MMRTVLLEAPAASGNHCCASDWKPGVEPAGALAVVMAEVAEVVTEAATKEEAAAF